MKTPPSHQTNSKKQAASPWRGRRKGAQPGSSSGATLCQQAFSTNAADLAHEILSLLVTKEYGVYHCTGEGVCSW